MKEKRKRSPLKTLALIGIILLGLAVFGTIGLLIGNFIVMPLIVGKGQEVKVPEVVGLTLEDAVGILQEQGFNAAGDETRPDTLYEEGTVIEQKPRSGAMVKKGRLVRLVISSGPEKKRVPYLLRLTLDQAEILSARQGFEIASIDTVENDTVPAGRIVAQKPDPEIRVEPGTKLRLYLSAGAVGKTIPAPNLIDITLEKAKEKAEADSLFVSVLRYMPIEGKGGIVVLQSPDAGVLLGAGDSIHVTVGKEP